MCSSDASISLFDFDMISIIDDISRAISISISIFSKQVSKYENRNFYAAITFNHSTLMSTFYYYHLMARRPTADHLQSMMHVKSLDTSTELINPCDLVVTKFFVTVPA